ncbi:peptidase inhibitor family I36 protein [Saccharothrix sp. BKS2]|uniref:peptidase inhibitor family I36 protein n=1 Tax=Saccharothrix sp. BKS2 TaxID=3064400 RepID=UPI0039EC07BF
MWNMNRSRNFTLVSAMAAALIASSPENAIAVDHPHGAVDPSSAHHQEDYVIVEEASEASCPDDAACFYSESQFDGTLVYYWNPVVNGCKTLPLRAVKSVINTTNVPLRIHPKKYCRGREVGATPGQARDIPVSRSWQ